jgi:hypothetical protein
MEPTSYCEKIARMQAQTARVPPGDLPPLYAAWVDEILQAPIPKETKATCDDCVMLSPGKEPHAGSGYSFDPRTKCCTYIPELPNFLVGRILCDDDPAFAKGRATLVKRLDEGVAVTPLGVGRSPTYRLLYEHAAGLMAFGRNRALRCPHYLEDEGGTCGIWRHRKSTCATWFCKYVRGATGLSFWRAVHQLLGTAEESLARWCVIELDVGGEALRQLFPPTGGEPTLFGPQFKGRSLDGVVDRDTGRLLWGRWAGRERLFFDECARRVNSLAWRNVAAIGGPEIRIRERLVRQAHALLISEEAPQGLRGAPIRVDPMHPDFDRIWTYSPLDPIDLPKPILSALRYFDGRPTPDALQAIAEELGTGMDETLLRTLVDYRVLVPSAEQAPADR